MNDARHAALTLHAMPPADRLWVLTRLDPPQRRLLESYLAELEALGIPADATLVDEALAQSGASWDEQEWRKELAAWPEETVAELLRREPPMLIARILNAGSWPWEKPVLDILAPEDGDAVAQAVQQGFAQSHELDEWLLRRLLQRCKAVVERDRRQP